MEIKVIGTERDRTGRDMDAHGAGADEKYPGLPPALTAVVHRATRDRLDKWAVSSETAEIGEFYAWIASEGTMTFAEVREQVHKGRLDGLDPANLVRMARLLAVQLIAPQHDEFVVDVLQLVLRHDPHNPAYRHHRKLLVEMLFEQGRFAEVRKLLGRHPDLASESWGYLDADTLNPFVTGNRADHAQWLQAFNRPFTSFGLGPVTVDPDAAKPFDTLSAVPESEVRHGGPLVSVIVTTYNPDPAEIVTAVQSILKQTWRNLEVLLVDDCSSQSDPVILDELAASDDRIRLIRLDPNGGTYRARNEGIKAARGEFITGQDTDDWSHPERIALQVDRLRDREDVAGVMTRATRMDDTLVRVSRGLVPVRRCEVSFMMRREDAIGVGGYLPVRKAGDSEFRERLERWTGKPTDVLDEPLYMIRLSLGSLSRSDFRVGWNHPMRTGFRNAYRRWHQTVEPAELALDNLGDEDRFPFAIAPNMRGKEYEPQRVDVCFVADWRGNSPQVGEVLEEIRACRDGGLSVAVLQMESPYGSNQFGTPILPEVQELINDGSVLQMYPHGPDTARNIIVRDPATVHLGRRASLGLAPDRLLIVADAEEMSIRDRDWTFDPAWTQSMAADIFDCQAEWVLTAADASSEKAAGTDFPVPVADWAYPVVLSAGWTARPPAPVRTEGVVLARRVGTDSGDWPANEEQIEAAYPTDGSGEYRWLGDADVLLDRVGRRTLPASWVCFGDGEIDPLIFWRSADFCLQFGGDSATGHPRRDVLEALAAGVVVVGDVGHQRAYGDFVVEVRPADAAETVRTLAENPEEYRRLALAGQKHVRARYGGQSLVRTLQDNNGDEDGTRT
ncbi:glycosyltransferase [Citricoccus sp. NPDC079358]|uniref:glycosyltransferase n=1 Tax=Citricoccus sp. NPDC079358 TaxID=3154653 RepID=UPI00345031BD